MRSARSPRRTWLRSFPRQWQPCLAVLLVAWTTSACLFGVDEDDTSTPRTFPPKITSHPANLTVRELGAANFSVTSNGTTPLTYQWSRAERGAQNFAALSGETSRDLNIPSVAMGDSGARFRVAVRNSAGGETSSIAELTVLANPCPVPPRNVAFDVSAPPALTPPAAVLGANAVVDPGFIGSVRVGSLPAGFGYWRFDAAVSVPAQQGIVPGSAPNMLQFVGSGQSGVFSGSASEMVQLVDVSALSTQIDAAQLQVSASAWFNRVVGCAETDDSFGVQIIAYDGVPATFAARQSAGVTQAADQGVSRDVAVVTGAWLRHLTGALIHDTPGTWRQAVATMNVPPGTRFLAIVLYAIENKFNDAVFPEFHGHYADDAAVVLNLRP